MEHSWQDSDYGVSCWACGYFVHSAPEKCSGRYVQTKLATIDADIERKQRLRAQIIEKYGDFLRVQAQAK